MPSNNATHRPCVRLRPSARGGGGQEGEPAGVREEERIAVITLFYGVCFFYLIVCTKTRGKEKNRKLIVCYYIFILFTYYKYYKYK